MAKLNYSTTIAIDSVRSTFHFYSMIGNDKSTIKHTVKNYTGVLFNEEFFKKFPYKVRDSVSSKYLKNYKIEKAEWESRSNRVIYKLQGMGWYSADELQPYKEETVEETDTMNHTTEINLNHPCFKGCNEIEIIIPDGWEFKQRDNKMFGVRKQYPKTYYGCCDILQLDHTFELNYLTIDEENLTDSLIRLMRCRDAYWKIAGEQIGLGKPWEPNWEDETEIYYTISYDGVNIKCYNNTDVYSKLAFPTAEMQDTFYKNFKDLIEECKEFL
jgi:hypothetical protein